MCSMELEGSKWFEALPKVPALHKQNLTHSVIFTRARERKGRNHFPVATTRHVFSNGHLPYTLLNMTSLPINVTLQAFHALQDSLVWHRHLASGAFSSLQKEVYLYPL